MTNLVPATGLVKIYGVKEEVLHHVQKVVNVKVLPHVAGENLQKESLQRESLVAGESLQRENLVAGKSLQRENLVAGESLQRESLVAGESLVVDKYTDPIVFHLFIYYIKS